MRRSLYPVLLTLALGGCSENDARAGSGSVNEPDAAVDAGNGGTGAGGAKSTGGSAGTGVVEAGGASGSIPFGACTPSNPMPVCTPGTAGCMCHWSAPVRLSNAAVGTTFGGFAAARDGVGGVMLLFTAASDSLVRFMRFDPAREAWSSAQNAPQVNQALIAFNGCGRALVFGYQVAGGSGIRGLFTHDVASGSWSEPVSPPGSVNSITMNAAGQAIALWQEAQFWSATAFEPLTSTFTAPAATGLSLLPKIGAIDTAGNFAACWNSASRFTPSNLWVEWYDTATGAWSGEPALQLSAGGSEAYPLFDAAGELHVIWNAPAESGAGVIRTARVDRVARTATDIQALSTTGNEAMLHLGATEPGDAAAVWVRQSDGAPGSCVLKPMGCEIVASRFDSAGNWSAPEVIGPRTAPDRPVAASSRGHAVLAWVSIAGSPLATPGVYASYFVRGSGWEPARPITAELPDVLQGEVRAIVTERGDAFLFWSQRAATATPTDPHEVWSARRVCTSSS